MKELSIMEWANEIEDNNLHHIGEYYTKKYGKPWRKKTEGLTKSFFHWMISMEKEDGFSKPISEISDRFETLRDWDGTFFIRRKVIK